MRILAVLLCLFSLPTFAKEKPVNFKLDDPAVLGAYALTPANIKSEFQDLQVRINEDNKLMAYMGDNEFELTGPDASGIVFDEDDEPNCDGDEQSCMYNKHVRITLTSMVSAGEQVPLFTVELTTDDSFDESGKSEETTIYSFEWVKRLQNGVSFFTRMEIPRSLKAFITKCEAVAEPALKDTASRAVDVCSINSGFKLREPLDKAIPALAEYYTNRKARQISAAELSKIVIEPAKNWIDGLEKASKADKTALKAQTEELKKYILKNSDVMLYNQFAYSAIVISVHKKSKKAVIYHIRNQK